MFNREKFLLRLIASVFCWQAAIFTYSLVYCINNGGLKACPGISTRYNETVNVMIATTLALIGTNTIINSQNQYKDEEESKDKRKAGDSSGPKPRDPSTKRSSDSP